MTQYRKNEVKESIDDAALKVFADKGFNLAKISDISALSGVSVGNIYRYYKNKEEIFGSVMPEDFPKSMLAIVREKIGAAREISDSKAVPGATNAFIDYLAANRERIMILFAGSGGTRFECAGAGLAEAMLDAVKAMYPKAYEAHAARHGGDGVLRLIYENLIGLYAGALRMDCGTEELTGRLREINAYHYSGIMRLMDLKEV